MIKLLKNKLFISMFLLVICVFITSSCFAAEIEVPSTLKYVTFDTLSAEYDLSSFNEYENILVFKNRTGVTVLPIPDGYDSIIIGNSYSKYYTTSDNYGVITYYYNSSTNEFSDNLVGYRYVDSELVHSEPSCLSYDTVYYTNSRINIYYTTKLINLDVHSIDNSTVSILYNYNEIYEEEHVKKIVYEISYDENNKKAQVSASIKNGVAGDKLYYSILGLRVTGKLMNPIELQQSELTAIKVTKNDLIHFQALDSER